MIYLDLMGRCGNQMFQYAFAKRIAEVQNDRITANFALIKSFSGVDDPSFRDELCGFKASENYIKVDSAPLRVKEFGSIKQKVIFGIYKKYRKMLGAAGKDPHIAERKFRSPLASCGIFLDSYLYGKTFEIKKIKQKNIFIKGYFENPAYFAPIADDIRTDFSPNTSISENASALMNEIVNCNSVCVSFRKWDVDGREICGQKYYEDAFEIIKQKVRNPVFVIFSNDVAWVKEHFSLPADCLFENDNNTIPEKIALMSACKHYIITNSTFCWWTQFLGNSPDKVVISPARWYEAQTGPVYLTDGDFILL